MNSEALERAKAQLEFLDLYVTALDARHLNGFNPKNHGALEGLKLQTMHVARQSEVLELTSGDGQLLRITLGFGVRWIEAGSNSEDKEEETEVKGQVEADFIVEYLMSAELDKEAIDEFALTNASYHAWPYWRELVMNQSERLRMPRVALPMRQFAQNRDVNLPSDS
ncbi:MULTISPECIES: preprotein translocase subunit SecB [Halomonadaceae]|uniref:Preprotein translocase subunit SecB n=1 Tax=Vreelandella halophila TaxID=86177 RepID=A0A9X5B735_9GAMM|nr:MULTISPECIES: preprotein translocase subunit SecB [Halomonas]MYL28154.1 preprotein translocase subunit SecB [Halomonas utahensis]MYL76061.1 preprotein translocase subunit SecB [Halomonas sp. 22501_18_FS]